MRKERCLRDAALTVGITERDEMRVMTGVAGGVDQMPVANRGPAASRVWRLWREKEYPHLFRRVRCEKSIEERVLARVHRRPVRVRRVVRAEQV